MEVFCTAKKLTEYQDTIEFSAFILQGWKLEPGTKLEQRRDEVVIATWELVNHTHKSLTVKKIGIPIEFGDMFYVENPEVIVIPVQVESEMTSALVFAGKNWKMASPKKWVPTELLTTTVQTGMKDTLGEVIILEKNYSVFKFINNLNETIFVAVLKTP